MKFLRALIVISDLSKYLKVLEKKKIKMLLPGVKAKVKEFRAMVTVEPCIAIFLVAMSVTGIANQNLLLDKTCRVNLGYSDEICDALIRRDMTNATIVR